MLVINRLNKRSSTRSSIWWLGAALVLLLAAAANPASAQRDWADDGGGGSTWNNNNNDWAGGQQQQWSSTRDPGESGSSVSDGFQPPNGPSLVRDNGGTAVRNRHGSKLKRQGPQQGFSGGFLPRTSRCSNPDLPGCESCSGDLCTACYGSLGDASFVLNEETNQCVCPPGYGMIAEEDLPVWWAGRRLLQLADAQHSNITADSSALQQQGQQQDWQEQPLVTTLGLPTPPPPWAAACLPCPVNFFSPGGAVGFTQCKVCPDQWTTGNSSASADCLVPYCAAGQEVNRRTGRCRVCPFGSYRAANSANLTCTVCPAGFTTTARASTSMADCRVPICQPGSQLDLDLFVCRTCTGNTISPGGVRANGPYQPFCTECPTFTAAVNRTVCFDQACPPPEAFRIVCRQDQLPACGPGAKPIKLDDYCTAFPVGAQLQWVRATITVDATTNQTTYGGIANNFTTPAVQPCPAGATGTNVWWPQITSFQGRTACLCTTDTSCRFTRQGQPAALLSAVRIESFNSTINVTFHDPQLTSLRRLLTSINSNQQNYTKFGARLGSYCQQDTSTSNGLQTSCQGPYLTSLTYSTYAGGSTAISMLNGTLPPANVLSGLSHLQRLNCSGCGLVGTLPPDWGSSEYLQALQVLDLGSNAFTGTLPESWGGFVNLARLTLSSSTKIQYIADTIPGFWANMRSLAFANLTALRVNPSGCVPSEWQTRNGLVPGSTLFTNAGQGFC